MQHSWKCYNSCMHDKNKPKIRRISAYIRENVQHNYPPGWDRSDWLVPYYDDQAVVHHSHIDPQDHSLCGPIVFCCRRSAGVYAELYPESAAARSAWRPTQASQIISWIDAGIALINIVFCFEGSPNGLFLIGLSSNEARWTINKEISFDSLVPLAKPL